MRHRRNSIDVSTALRRSALEVDNQSILSGFYLDANIDWVITDTIFVQFVFSVEDAYTLERHNPRIGWWRQ